MPLTWEELEKARQAKKPDALYFEPAVVLKRLDKLSDLFAPVLKLKQGVEKAVRDAPA